ncbi:SdrD B-like domain-containing protein [Populibacterium corticicola]|uniref:SdrD B-like domain-containing protein n=1 Tax=Populibacterium corticicola TaxID=1812826 RepID=A0ABW5XG90_9MICO
MRALSMIMATLLVVMGFPAAASAAEDDVAPGVSVEAPNFGSPDESGRIHVEEGKEYEFAFVYTPEEFDDDHSLYSPLKFELNLDGVGSVDIPDAALVVPEANRNSIEKIERATDGVGILVFFKEDMSASNEQENFKLKFTLDLNGSATGEGKISWSGATEPTTLLIIAKDAEPVVVNPGFDKAVNIHPVQIPTPAGKDGTLNLSSYNGRVGYRLVTEVEQGGTITLSDHVDVEWLGFDTASMNLQVSYETWEGISEGYGKRTRYPANANDFLPASAYTLSIDSDKNGFTLVVPGIPDGSRLVVTYQADIIDAPAFLAETQSAHDAVYGPAGSRKHNAEYKLPKVNNTAEAYLGDTKIDDDTEYVEYHGYTYNMPGPGQGLFYKEIDTSGNENFGPRRDFSFKDFEADPSRKLIQSETVTYRLRADLRVFTASEAQIAGGIDDNYNLNADVIITDVLPIGQTWGDITATVNGSPQNLTAYTGSGNPTSRGEYKIDGQNLIINIGRSNADNWTILASAQLSTFTSSGVDARNGRPALPARDAETNYHNYSSVNTAKFEFKTVGNDGAPTRSADVVAKWRGDTTQGITDSSVFTKTTDSFAEATPGQPLEIDYTITVKANSTNDDKILASKTEIIDLVDESVFDLGNNLENVKIEGTYGTRALGQNAFALERVANADGQGTPGISIKPAQPFLDAIGDLGEEETLTIKLTLTTFPIEGRQVLEIENRALYRGERAIDGDYLAGASMKGSSLGNGIQVYKEVYDPTTGEFTDSLRVKHTAGNPDDGTFDDGKFTYRIALVVPRSWDTRMRDIVDALDAAGLDFDGFVNDPEATVVTTAPKSLGRNITVSIDDGDIRIHSSSVTGGSGDSSDVYSFLYRAEVRDWENLTDVPVVNKVGKSTVTITKTNEYPLNLAKVDSSKIGMDPEDPAFDETITDLEARFEVRDSAGALLFDDIYVVDGKLVRPLQGELPNAQSYRAVLVPNPGTYAVKEIKAPAGFFLNKTEYPVTVAVNGATALVEIPNDPMNAGTVSLAKVVDGVPSALADGTEFTFSWVAEIPDAEDYDDVMKSGSIVVEANGSPVAINHEFPPGTKVTFSETGTPETAFAGHRFAGVTYAGANEATVLANTDVNITATNTYTPYVSVGDLVWIDTDRNGLQDGGEPGIPGVKLILTDGAGNAVTDVDGNAVKPAVTDENGNYTFEKLPVLTNGERYIVKIDRDDADTEDALALYHPTAEGADNGSGEFDSSTWESVATHVGLTQGGDRNPTLDFGFVRNKVRIGDFVWVDENRDGLQDTGEPGIEGVKLIVTLVDEDGEPVLDDDGKPVVVKDVYGNTVAPQVTDTDGKYLFEDLPALNTGTQYKVTIDTTDAGTKKALEPYVPTIPGAGNDEGNDSSTSSEVAPWRGLQEDGAENLTLDFGFVTPSFAIGDIVWIDSNRDGIQGADEKPLAGVTVTLLDAATGEPVTVDIAGNDIKPIVTGKDGKYLFDNLPAGTYKVQFELTEEQGKTYKFTSNVPGANSTDNSDGVVTKNPLVAVTKDIVLDRTNGALDTEYDAKFIATQGVDPTWDAGVVLKSVSVGDYVWFDENGNGKQDKNEKGIGDVKLVLTDKNGKPVKDIFGNEVPAVWTDKDGKYTFDNLPPLEPGQEYRVKIDRKDAKTKKALEKYLPTLENQGDPAFDSSTWIAIATSEGLTEDGDRNDTLDFGFILDPKWADTGDDGHEREPNKKPDQSTDGENNEREELEQTGFGGVPVIVFSTLLLALGGAFLAIRRRHTV